MSTVKSITNSIGENWTDERKYIIYGLTMIIEKLDARLPASSERNRIESSYFVAKLVVQFGIL